MLKLFDAKHINFSVFTKGLERYHLPQAFGKYTEIYMLRIEALKHALLNGRLHKAKQLCNLDFEPG